MTTPANIPQYRSHKIVGALQIRDITIPPGNMQQRVVHFQEAGFEPITVDVAMFARYMPVQGDYFIFYRDDYQSVSPRKEFVDGYTAV